MSMLVTLIIYMVHLTLLQCTQQHCHQKYRLCRSVIEEIADGAEEVDLGGRSIAMRAYASWFNFKGADQQKSVGVLSGGERNRLQLAKVSSGPL